MGPSDCRVRSGLHFGCPYSRPSSARLRRRPRLSPASSLIFPCVPSSLHRRVPDLLVPVSSNQDVSLRHLNAGSALSFLPSQLPRQFLFHDASSTVHFRYGPQFRLASRAGFRCFVRLVPTCPVTPARLVSGYLTEQDNCQDTLLPSCKISDLQVTHSETQKPRY